MSDSRTDKLLREFLEREAEERSKGITLESLHHAIKRLADDRLRDRARADAHGRRLRRVEGEVARLSVDAPGPNWSPDPREITGTYELRALKQEVAEAKAERRSESTFWRRKRWDLFFAGLGALILAAASAAIAKFMK